MNTRKLLSLGFGAAALAGVVGGGTVLAQGGTSGLTSGLSSVVQQVNPAADDTHKAEQDAYLQSLATRLGVSVDTLKQALKDTSLEKLAQLVTDGKLTQEQADRIKTEIESGEHLFFGPGGMRAGRGGHEGRGGAGIHDSAALTAFLGIDESTLRSEMQAGKSLATIATDHGKTRDQLKAFLTDQMNTELAQKVADGKITQAQADQMKTAMAGGLDAMIDGTGRGPGGAGGPKGGHHEGSMGPGRMTPPGANSPGGSGQGA
ncbi:MAG: hypothetical protein C0506_15120 [Anaerolinea sp.]|nr:hypothetical protein [Anaerolinea sp.]